MRGICPVVLALALVAGCAIATPATSDPAASGDLATPGGDVAAPGHDFATPGGDVAAPGTVVVATLEDPGSLNPLLAVDDLSREVMGLAWPGLLRLDPHSGRPVAALADRWTVAADGRRLTFHLRPGLRWSDGRPLTSADVRASLLALAGPAVQAAREDGLGLIGGVDAPDETTVVVRLRRADCTVLADLGVGIVPAADVPALAGSSDAHFDRVPSAASGPLLPHVLGARDWRAAATAGLILVPNRLSSRPAHPVPLVRFQPYAEPSQALAALFAGQVDITPVEPKDVGLVASAAQRGERVAVRGVPEDGYVALMLNLADPDRPRAGWADRDGDGHRDAGEPFAAQPPHPILGALPVRRALARAIDVDRLIEQAAFGQGVRLAANVPPAVSWAHDPDLAPWSCDPRAAADLLAADGWVDADGDGVRERAGVRLRLGLAFSAGNVTRNREAARIRADAAAVGFELVPEPLEYGALLQRVLGQTFDLALVAWRDLGADPDDAALWRRDEDLPGVGLNVTSFQSATVEDHLAAARTAPRCEIAVRAPHLAAVQRILRDEVPCVFLYTPLAPVAWRTRLTGFAPGPWSCLGQLGDR